jgi:hypothetical protein
MQTYYTTFYIFTVQGSSCSWSYSSVFTTTYISVPITSKVVSSNPAHGDVYSIQQYVIKFVSDLRRAYPFRFLLNHKCSSRVTTNVLLSCQQYFSYIVAVSLIGGGNRRKLSILFHWVQWYSIKLWCVFSRSGPYNFCFTIYLEHINLCCVYVLWSLVLCTHTIHYENLSNSFTFIIHI